MPHDPSLSAQVVLAPAGGPPDTEITAASLEAHRPDPAAAQRVADHLRSVGFEVGDLVGISFAVTGSRSRFEASFGVELRVGESPSGSVTHVTTAGGDLELPLDRLPDEVAGAVTAITFTPPPDFGPGGFA